MTIKKLNTIFLLIFFFLFSFISVGYSALSQQLTISGDVAYEHFEPTLYNVLKREAKKGTYAKEYTGSHQDSMAGVGSEKIYHWYAANSTESAVIKDKNNVIFANHCWQMMRTTDTGGVKLLYNGEVENNQCLSTRGNHVGYDSRASQNLASNYWYGTSYTYDSSNQTFQLSGNTELVTWNATTGPGLVGKYTCKNTSVSGTCSTLYYVEKYLSATNGSLLSLNSSSHYSQFGTLQFNSASNSPAYVGYMYGDVYASSSTSNTSRYYGSSVSWNGTNYTLVNPIQTSNQTDISTHHYTCYSDGSMSSCSTIAYVFYMTSSTIYFVKLENGVTTINQVLNNMFTKNTNNSIMKNGVEAWYKKYLLSYDNYIEDTIFCGDRSFENIAGWDDTGAGNMAYPLRFINYSSESDFSCPNVTDQFSVSNYSAQLSYKVGLAIRPEIEKIKNKTAYITGQPFFLFSPGDYRIFTTYQNAEMILFSAAGSTGGYAVDNIYGVKPAIALKPGTEFVSGDGSMANPYVVDASPPAAPQSFSTDSWSTIIYAVRSGNTSAYHVGDTKTVDMGSLGTHTLRIANTSTPSECSTSGFSQTACGFVLEFVDIISNQKLNSTTNTNVGGWPATNGRTYVNSTIYNALPADLRNGIINTTVVSGHGSTSGETNFTSTDKLYLLSVAELSSNNSVDTAASQSRMLDYYSANNNNNSRIKKYNNTAAYWWNRTPGNNNSTFYTVSGAGYAGSNSQGANISTGVSPAFRIG